MMLDNTQHFRRDGKSNLRDSRVIAAKSLNNRAILPQAVACDAMCHEFYVSDTFTRPSLTLARKPQEQNVNFLKYTQISMRVTKKT